MDQQSMTIFSYYVGALAIGGGLITTLVCCYNRLPRARMKIFQGILLETRNLYQQVRNEGLVPDPIIDEFGTRLRGLEESSISLRDSTHQCTSLFQEVVAAYYGLSTAIQISIKQAVSLQAKIATASEEQRRMRRLLDAPGDTNQRYFLATITNSGTSTHAETVDLPDYIDTQCPLPCISSGT
ncbi:hypothetical protein H2248_011364 [Termitomyces sp. 'cryptogamus']|nr:hypothetical protein H2248_011364 [Termitomyces sp. 'cryptogamus']